MKREQILETIRMLAHSQGFYGRLYNHLMEMQEYDEDSYEDTMTFLESQNLKDAVDLVMMLEG